MWARHVAWWQGAPTAEQGQAKIFKMFLDQAMLPIRKSAWHHVDITV